MASDKYVDLVFAVLGEPSHRYADMHAWRVLEADLGCALPSDYKRIVDAYAPVQINEHLYLSHPFPERWNLRESIRRTSDSWAQVVWDDDEKQGAPWVSLGVSDLTFGTADGLIPLVSTDRGRLFSTPHVAQMVRACSSWRMVMVSSLSSPWGSPNGFTATWLARTWRVQAVPPFTQGPSP